MTDTAAVPTNAGISSPRQASREDDWGRRDPRWSGVRSETVAVQGHPVHVLRHHATGEGPPQLLIHGLGGSARNWLDVMVPLAGHGETIAVDLPGFGETTVPEGGSARVRANAHFVRALLDTLGWERATLMGNSLGGLIATLAAGWWPQRVGRLVLVNPALPNLRREMHRIPKRVFSRILPASLPGIGRLLVEAGYRAKPAEQLVDESLAAVFADVEAVRPALREILVENVTRAQQEPWRRAAIHDACRTMVEMHVEGRTIDRAIDAITAETLVVWGDADRLIGRHMIDGLFVRRSDWTRRQFEAIGHAPMLECPDRFVDAVASWYGSSDPGAASSAARSEVPCPSTPLPRDLPAD